MRKTILIAALTILAGSAQAGTYPVSGRWGANAPPAKTPIDCSGLRVIAFNGDQRTDSRGGVPAYRNVSVTADGNTRYRVVDEFTTGQISNARVTYTLQLVDSLHVVLSQPGGTLTLQRCR